MRLILRTLSLCFPLEFPEVPKCVPSVQNDLSVNLVTKSLNINHFGSFENRTMNVQTAFVEKDLS